MTDNDLMKLLLASEGYLKQTTVGYVGHSSSWYNNTTTMWYKGLNLLDQVVSEIKRRLNITISLTGTAQVSSTLTATIKVG